MRNSIIWLLVCGVLFGVASAEAGFLKKRNRDLKSADASTFEELGADASEYAGKLGAGDYRRTITVEGRERFYDLHVPESMPEGKPVALVFNFHGGGGRPLSQRNESLMDPVSDKHGFIVVYPAGSGIMKDKLLTWNIGMSDAFATKKNIDDIAFVKAMLKDLKTIFKVDDRRIYSAGFSQGAILSYKLACEMSETFAAIAPVSGIMQVSPSDCNPTRPVSIIHFHGLADENVVFEGGVGKEAIDKYDRPGVEQTLAFWRKANGISDKVEDTGGKGDASFEKYGPGKEGSEIILWKLDGCGHTWPGGQTTLAESVVGKMSRSITASELIWQFFEKHPKK